MSLRFFFSFVLIALKSFKHLLHPETQENWIFLSLIGWSWSTLGPFSWAHHLRYPCFSQETLKELTLLSGLSFASSSTLCLAFQTLCLKVDPVSLSPTPSSVPPRTLQTSIPVKFLRSSQSVVHWRTGLFCFECVHSILRDTPFCTQVCTHASLPDRLGLSQVGHECWLTLLESADILNLVPVSPRHFEFIWLAITLVPTERNKGTWWTAVWEIFVQC